jgi:light-regulated signal transduction histidine kinase (bacteriophytochrome)
LGVHETGSTPEYDDLPVVYGDRLQLTRVFQNLIGNALKFHGPELPRVSIQASATPDGWAFTIRDNGIGMEPEQAERIFGLFQRLHNQEDYPGQRDRSVGDQAHR